MTEDQHPNYIAPRDLVQGATYKGEGRNFDVGIWDGKRFHGYREKYGGGFIAEEIHWDDDPHWGTFKPFKRIDND